MPSLLSNGFVRVEIDRKKLGLSADAARRISEAVLHSMAEEWHTEYLPQHFTESATMRYGYAYRKPRYLRRKRARVGHQKPLVFTGEALLLSRQQIIRGNSKTVRVILPRKLNRNNPKSKAKMQIEATRVLPIEAEHLQDIGQITLGDQLAKNLE